MSEVVNGHECIYDWRRMLIAICIVLITVVGMAYVAPLIWSMHRPLTAGQEPLRTRILVLNTPYNYVLGIREEVLLDGYVVVLETPEQQKKGYELVGEDDDGAVFIFRGEPPFTPCFHNPFNYTLMLYALEEKYPAVYEAYALKELKPGTQYCFLTSYNVILEVKK